MVTFIAIAIMQLNAHYFNVKLIRFSIKKRTEKGD